MIKPTYFVYQHRRLDTGDVFYIGKGTRTHKNQYERAFIIRRRSKYWNSIVAKSGHVVELLADFFVESDAFDLERDLIASHRRTCDGGTLCNLTLGGEGHTGFPMSDAARKKLSAATSGEKHFNWGKKLSAETCRRKSESLKASEHNLRGKKLPDWWKSRIAATKVGALNPMFGKTGSAHPGSRPVVDKSNGTTYPSMTAAARSIDMKVGTLYSMLAGLNPNRTSMEFA